jgi:NAD+ synthase
VSQVARLSAAALAMDCERAATEIVDGLRGVVASFHRKGAVVGVSGGIDSAVTVALCARAFGGESVLAFRQEWRWRPGREGHSRIL